ncbi:MAG: C39 family peptidase [bacterium]|nr:C39 family peptidase [bacterium]
MRRRIPTQIALQRTAIGLLSLVFISCATTVPLMRKQPSEKAVVIEFKHEQSAETSDCLAVCADMVMQYYGINQSVPDSILPLDLMELSNSLNSSATLDAAGHILFSAVLGMTPDDITTQIVKERPLIVAYRPTSNEEYHSVVITGADPVRKRFYVSDPASRKPGWVKMSKFSTFADTGMFLVMLIGLRES